MKAAKAYAGVIYATCPHCKAAIEDKNGSQMITSDSFPDDILECWTCKKKSQMPKTVRLWA